MNKIITTSLAGILLLGGCGTDEGSTDESQSNNVEEEQEEQNTGDSNQQDQSNTLDKEQAQKVLESYRNSYEDLKKEQNGKIQNYKTEEDLKEHFSKIMSQEHAQYMLDTYYEMKDDSLYAKAIDGPRYLHTDQPFELQKEGKGTYQVIQEIDNELRGHVRFTFTLTTNDSGSWIVQEVSSERLD